MSQNNTTTETQLATDLGAVADALVEQARAGVELTGPGGLLTRLVQRLLHIDEQEPRTADSASLP